MSSREFLFLGSSFLLLAIVTGAFLYIYSSALNIYLILLSGSVALSGIFLLVWGVAKTYSEISIGVPELRLSKNSLYLGDQFTLDVYHKFVRDIIVETITVQLLLRETEDWSDEHKVDEIVYEHHTLAGGEVFGGQTISNMFPMRIPEDAHPTTRMTHTHYFQWFIRFKVNILRLPDFTYEQEIVVQSKEG